MADDKSVLRAFLSKFLLFSNLNENLLEEVVNACEIIELGPGKTLYHDGEKAKDFYIIWSGRLVMFKPSDRNRQLATLIIGDFFGEDWLVSKKRLGSVEARETSKLIKLDWALMQDLFLQAPQLKKLLTCAAKSRKLIYKKHQRILGEDETLYFFGRKHVFFLFLKLLLPALFIMISSYFVWLSLLTYDTSSIRLWIPFLFGILSVLWLLWSALDWSNDYYIVTSLRVIWAEKIIAIYDSRQEAPLDTILTIKRVFNPTLRMLVNYGTVIVKTYTGSITMRWSQDPDEMVFFIENFKARARAIARQRDNLAMEDMIQGRLTPNSQVIQRPVSTNANVKPSPGKSDSWAWLRNAFKMRYTEGDHIIYRKHWFILIKKTFFPGIINMALIFLAVYFFLMGSFFNLPIIIFWIIVLAAGGGWWLYQYIDWRNDIYILTLDKIFDIERKPLTREEKREASLANILSLENARVNFIGILLNYGTVTLNVGNEKLTFDTVYNPVQVQYEISDRMYAYNRRLEQEQALKEREQMADWLMVYHQQVNKNQNNQNTTGKADF